MSLRIGGSEMTGLLFDLDGTLLDTLEDLKDATNHVLREAGYPERSLEQIRQAVGNGAENQLRRSLPQDVPEERLQALLREYKAYYNTHCQIKTAPYAGVLEALAQLQGEYPVAVVSNKPDATVKTLCALYFPGTYALGESPDCPRKPAPDMVKKGMEAIGAEKCIYIGDSEVDVLTARNAGVPCLSVLWGFRDRKLLESRGATHFCEAPEQLADCLEAMAKEL